MHQLAAELRMALRTMARDRAYSIPVLLTLTLCLAATAAVVSVLQSVVLRPLPLAEPERLVAVSNSFPGAGVAEASNSVPDYYDRQALPAFEEVAIYSDTGRTLGTATGAERVTGMRTTPSLFHLLRAQAFRGRTLQEADGVPGQEHKVVLSHALWQQLFGGRNDAIGKDLLVNGVPHTVIGVMPDDFLFLQSDVRFWIPLAFKPEDRADDQRYNNSYDCIARLRPGATVEQAQQQLLAQVRTNLDRNPALKQPLIDAGYTMHASLLQERVVRDVRRPLFLLTAGVLFLLLIGCVNVANLTLVRASNRWRELAARQALGAGPGRLLRQLFAEALALTVTAAAAGTLLAWFVLRAMAHFAADAIPRGAEIRLAPSTVLVIAAIAVALAMLLSSIPLLQGARTSLAHTLRQEGRGGTAGRGVRALRRALVATQVAFAFVLLLGAGLLMASFRELLRVQPGYVAAGALTGKVSLPSALYPKDEQVLAWADRALERVRAIPGVTAAGFNSTAPLGGGYNDSVIVAEGYVAKPGESVVSPARNSVSSGYFAALGIPLREGRFIDERDTAASAHVVVVDEQLAKKFWPGKSPLGRRLYSPDSAEDIVHPGPNVRWVTVVGVVGAVKQRGLVSSDERAGAYYFPLQQVPERTLMLAIRTKGDAHRLIGTVRAQLAGIDAQLPLYDIKTMEERIDASVAGRRAALRLASAFGALALLLATLGIYGALSYQVTQRTREIGIRMALGSESRNVFRLVLTEGAALLAVGLLVGAVGMVALRKALAGVLYGVTPFEPTVLLTATLVLTLVALAACFVPARRAAAIDPLVALGD